MKKIEVDLIDVRTEEKIKKFITEKEFKNLPFYLCLPYEYEDRKKEYFKEMEKRCLENEQERIKF